MSKILCDGHEYSVVYGNHSYRARNNYGTTVGYAHGSLVDDSWTFRAYAGVDGLYHSHKFSAKELRGYTVSQQLVRWLTVVKPEG